MTQSFTISAQPREQVGKGASRRLRHSGFVPGIVYGGTLAPQMITVPHSDLIKHLENEAFYSTLLTLNIGDQSTQVVLKDLHRHPAKPFILHVDFQRVRQDERLRLTVPIHFENETTCQAVKLGGKVSHNVTEVDITCLPKDLPEYLSVDMNTLSVGDIVHLSQLHLPAGVEFATHLDLETPVVLIHAGYSGTDTDDEISDDE
jgi:large subunit ribosomal protein L25